VPVFSKHINAVPENKYSQKFQINKIYIASNSPNYPESEKIPTNFPYPDSIP